MSKIVAVANAKGGVGKSHHTFFLACRAAEANKKVAIIGAERDAAFNPNIKKNNGIKNITVLDGHNADMPKQLATLKSQFDLIIIDTAGNNLNLNDAKQDGLTEKLIKFYILRSDFILIPVDPDSESARKTLSFIKKLDILKSSTGAKFKALVFVNKGKKTEVMTRQIAKNLQNKSDVAPLSKTIVRVATGFAQAFAKREAPWVFKPDLPQNLDLKQLHKEVFDSIGLNVL